MLPSKLLDLYTKGGDICRDTNVYSGSNLSTRRRHPVARIIRCRRASQASLLISGEVFRGPQSHVVSRYGAACRMCQGRLQRRASRSQWGRALRIAVGAARNDTAQRPYRWGGFTHLVLCTNPLRVSRPMDEAACTHLDAHSRYQGLWRRYGNVTRLSLWCEPHYPQGRYCDAPFLGIKMQKLNSLKIMKNCLNKYFL